MITPRPLVCRLNLTDIFSRSTKLRPTTNDCQYTRATPVASRTTGKITDITVVDRSHFHLPGRVALMCGRGEILPLPLVYFVFVSTSCPCARAACNLALPPPPSRNQALQPHERHCFDPRFLLLIFNYSRPTAVSRLLEEFHPSTLQTDVTGVQQYGNCESDLEAHSSTVLFKLPCRPQAPTTTRRVLGSGSR